VTLDRDLDAAEAAELRLEARSRERREELAKRARRRRLRLWILAPVVLPALGAAALVAALEREGGDFGGWPAWRVALVLAGTFLLPALVAGWLARRRGVLEALAWAIACVCIEVVLVFGVGFLLLDYGPR
jgi:peptidoglycan/LPS O-acetylase OafA/YrhL